MTRTTDEPLTFRGSVGVIGNKIAMVSSSEEDTAKFRENSTELREIDLRGKVLMPGLINTHTHASMAMLRGYSDDVELMEWLEDYVWPFEAHQSGDHIEVGARLGITEMLLGGTTTFVDMYWQMDRVARAVRDMKIRAVLASALIDGNAATYHDDIVKALEAAKGCDRIQIAVAPHAPYTCSPETITLAVNLAKEYDLPLTTHIAETKVEEAIIAERYGKTPMEVYRDLGALSERTIAAHCVVLSDSDIEIMRTTGIAVAHNCQSNMKLANGIAPISKLNERGVLCTIATDSACSNNDLDMWEEIRTASLLQKVATGSPCALPAYEVLKMATVNGAKAIGYEGSLGIIAEGALADMIVIDTFKPHLHPIHNIVANLVYSTKASDVEMVLVDGEIVVENSKVIGVDYSELFASVDTAISEVKAQLSTNH